MIHIICMEFLYSNLFPPMLRFQIFKLNTVKNNIRKIEIFVK